MQAKEFGRRTVIGGAGALIAGYKLKRDDQFPALIERIFSSPASIGFAEGQRLSSNTRSGVLVLPGQFIRSTQDVATALTPSLSELGTVMYAKYGNTQVDIGGLEKSLYRIQNNSKMKTLSLYCDSDGLDIAGELIPKIGNRFNIDYIFADCSPYDLADAKLFGLNKVADLYLASPYGNSAFLTATFDQSFNHDPLAPYLPGSNVAPPGTAYSEGEAFAHAETINDNLAAYIKKYNETPGRPRVKVVFLRPQNPAKDGVVDDVQSEKDLKRIYPDLTVGEIGGQNQGHNNPVTNPDEYNWVIRRIIENLSKMKRR